MHSYRGMDCQCFLNWEDDAIGWCPIIQWLRPRSPTCGTARAQPDAVTTPAVLLGSHAARGRLTTPKLSTIVFGRCGFDPKELRLPKVGLHSRVSIKKGVIGFPRTRFALLARSIPIRPNRCCMPCASVGASSVLRRQDVLDNVEKLGGVEQLLVAHVSERHGGYRKVLRLLATALPPAIVNKVRKRWSGLGWEGEVWVRVGAGEGGGGARGGGKGR